VADPLSGGAQIEGPKADSIVAKADHALYSVEKAIAWVGVLVMAGAYFLAILERNLTGGFGENAIDAFILGQLGKTAQEVKTNNPELAESIHNVWGPAIFASMVLLLLLAAAFTVRRKEGEPELTNARRMRLLGVGIVGVLAMLGAVLYLPSHHLTAALLAAGFAAGMWQVRKNMVSIGLWAVVGAASLWGVYNLLETGYAWSKELSMVLLMWVGFVGASMATYENRNIQVDFIRKNVPRAWRVNYELFGSVVTAGFTLLLAALAYDNVRVALDTGGVLNEVLVGDYLIPLPIAVGFIAVAARFLLRAARLVAGTETIGDINEAPDSPRRFLIAAGIIGGLAVLAVVGIGPKGGGLIALLLGLILTGAPLYVLIGGLALGCFGFWPTEPEWATSFDLFTKNFNMMSRMRGLASQEALIAIPFFMVAGAIMSRGAIAGQLVECARAAFGWLPGGLAVSTVIACMFFAAISGSSPVTVITIGAVMYPALREAGYPDRFSMGLVTSAGSLGIIIPPSIPMIVYAIFATMNGATVHIKHLFIAGIGPGIVIGTALATLCVIKGRSIKREEFSWGRLGRAFKEGFWALFLPGFILIGIYLGFFNAIEAAAIAVVLALGIELFVHRQLTLKELPAILADSASLMGSILVIISVALGLSEFLTIKEIPGMLVEYLASYELTSIQFMLMLNVMLILVGCLMDIISAMILFVPLIIPLALKLGIDPIHLGLVFIVNLEIGYLTPPLGLNLFVSSGFFQKPFGEVMRSVLPFIGALAVSLAIVTAIPTISLGMVNMMQDKPIYTPFPTGKVLKPEENKVLDTTPTSFVTQAVAAEDAPTADGGHEAPSASLAAITNRSRESEVEATGDMIDFETFGVRGMAIKVDGKHTRTAVMITSNSENCVAEGEEPDDDEEWYLRIDIPAGAKANQTFAVGKDDVVVEMIRIEEGKREVTKPDSGMVIVLTPEKDEAIAVMGPDGFTTEGLFGAFELKFGEDVINGKFVPSPCEEGAPYFK